MKHLAGRRETVTARLAELERKRRDLAAAWREQLLELWYQARRDRTVTRRIIQFGRQENRYLIVGEIPEETTQAVQEMVQTTASAPFATITTSTSASKESLAARVIERIRYISGTETGLG